MNKYDSLEEMKSEEYREVLRAIRDVLNDVNQINMGSTAAQEWMAEHIIWRLWCLKNESKDSLESERIK
jgi:hypothetical protein